MKKHDYFKTLKDIQNQNLTGRLTINDALGRVLNITVTPLNIEDYTHPSEYQEVIENTPSIMDILEAEIDRCVPENAETDAELQTELSELRRCVEQYRKANELQNALIHEIYQIRKNHPSKLMIVSEGEPDTSLQQVEFTENSFDEWLRGTEWAGTPNEHQSKEALSPTKERGYLLTIALLAEALAECCGKTYFEDGKITSAESLAKHVIDLKGEYKTQGFETLRKRILEAEKSKEKSSQNSPRTKKVSKAANFDQAVD